MLGKHRYAPPYVASLAGAWIETPSSCSSSTAISVSPPSRGRGSKRWSGAQRHAGCWVASLAGAWIETSCVGTCHARQSVASLAGAWIETPPVCLPALMRWCRLPRGGVDRNSTVTASTVPAARSPPSRGRGSKLLGDAGQQSERHVASLAGAWIETLQSSSLKAEMPSRLPRGGVDRNADHRVDHRVDFGRLPRGGVDRNLAERRDGTIYGQSPPSRGRGSKLAEAWVPMTSVQSPPSRGRGSKQWSCGDRYSRWRSPPSRGRGSKRRKREAGGVRQWVASLAGAWIETSPRR